MVQVRPVVRQHPEYKFRFSHGAVRARVSEFFRQFPRFPWTVCNGDLQLTGQLRSESVFCLQRSRIFPPTAVARLRLGVRLFIAFMFEVPIIIYLFFF